MELVPMYLMLYIEPNLYSCILTLLDNILQITL